MFDDDDDGPSSFDPYTYIFETCFPGLSLQAVLYI